ncbi:flagellar hook protein FlgE [Terracoccus sp. 273MFTsu3.1]|uniref:flagellar hook protein FlgE n=1 Tax=Terracoccus sp. 273MFTsu3.1 TaxID=1172188 RepID=UPI000380B87D|nr:flagellar hook protein FlgE [Terracoccus sp. 273MFTsu3.1]
MLRSLYSGISGLRAHQTMLDVTGNNIANVNTTGFKGSSTQFQDTLSQLTQGASGPQGLTGGTNPAQIGLGVRVAGVTTSFTQGSAQTTGKATDMMISGDGFFVTNKGGQQYFTRAGSFGLDASGHLVGPDGGILQGWLGDASGRVNTGGPTTDLLLTPTTTMPARATTSVSVSGNLPSDAAAGTSLQRDIQVYDASGVARSLSMTFTRTAAGWNVSAADASGATGTGSLTFVDGKQSTPGSVTVGGISVDLGAVSGYAGSATVAATGQDGYKAGNLEAFSLGADGSLVGAFSNGVRQTVGRVALARFTNPEGLEKAGDSSYSSTANSGGPQIGQAGDAGFGSLVGGALEMSNVDLSQEFTNLIVAQRGFQANARIITTSDQVLQELVDLKR